jgi:hypothetical protein
MKLIWSLDGKRAVTQEKVEEIKACTQVGKYSTFDLIIIPYKGDPFIVKEFRSLEELQKFAQELMD